MIISLYKIKTWMNIQFTKIKYLGMVISVIMLTMTLTLQIYEFLQWRKINLYFAVPIIFFTLLLILLAFSHVWMNKWHMYDSQRMAEAVLYNPYAVWAFTPFQMMYFRHVYIPLMESEYRRQDDEGKKELMKHIKLVKKWVKLGYIPKEDFPKYLRKYYLGEGKLL